MARSYVRMFALMFLGASLVAYVGCSGEEAPVSSATSKFQPADDGAGGNAATITDDNAANPTPLAKPTTVAKPEPITVDKLDAESLPEGPPAAILAFMKQMHGYEPRGITQEAKRADYIRMLRLMMTAGDRALALEDATPKERRDAAQMRLMAVLSLARQGEPKADEELTAYCLRLKRDEDPGVSQIGRSILFSMDVSKMMDNDQADPKPVMEELKALLTGEDPEHVIFMIGQQAVQAFSQRGFNDEAAEALTLLGARYQDDADEQVAAQARSLLKQAPLLKLNLPKKLSSLLAAKPSPAAQQEFMAAMQQMFTIGEMDEVKLQYAQEVVQILEQSEQYEVAGQILALVEQSFSQTQDEKLAAQAQELVGMAHKRLSLIGQPFAVSGQTLDGQPFDPASLQGKVVLVDFWATWCGPCLDEIPNIKKYYEMYKDKGFEVVGYNLDENRENVDRFFAVQPLPWTTLVSENAQKLGTDSPLAAACGVQGIPFLVLIDQQGKVVALHPRGDKLGEKLIELLGPADGAIPEAATQQQAGG